TNSLIKVIVILIILLTGTKVAFHFLFPNSLFETFMNITKFHCMMIGALGSMLYIRKHALFLKLIDNKLTQCICWFIILLVALNKWHLYSVIDNEIISVISLFLIIGQIGVMNRIINLELNLLNFLGKISYGIYVIHPLVIFFLYKGLFPYINAEGVSGFVMVYALVLIMTILLSHLSYEYFEKYFLKLKEKVSVVKSSGSKDF
ncbi:MAG TPA: acyltransferase family protein, partial [Bacteroidia bacterium]|nr:acyltransferase family protein [Bacteroidia bacterium]